jgi:hypothetical protein
LDNCLLWQDIHFLHDFIHFELAGMQLAVNFAVVFRKEEIDCQSYYKGPIGGKREQISLPPGCIEKRMVIAQ